MKSDVSFNEILVESINDIRILVNVFMILMIDKIQKRNEVKLKCERESR